MSCLTNKAQNIVDETFFSIPLFKINESFSFENPTFNLFMHFELIELFKNNLYIIYSLDEYNGKTILSNVVYTENQPSSMFSRESYSSDIEWRMAIKDYRCLNFVYNFINCLSRIVKGPFNVFIDSNMKILNDVIVQGQSKEKIKKFNEFEKTLNFQFYSLVLNNNIGLRYQEYKPIEIDCESEEYELLNV